MKRDDPPDGDRSVDVSAADFRALFEAVSNWGRWGDDDERGALNYLTPDRVAAAAGLIRSGETTTLSLPLNTTPAIDNPCPADHHMTMLNDVDIGSGTLRFAKDYIGVDYHNDGHSHIDALCHVAFDGSLYDGRPSGSITGEGARSMRSRWSRTASSDAACCSTFLGCGVSPGSSPASTSFERTWREPSSAGRDRRRWRHPAGSDRSLSPPGGAGSMGHPEGQGGPAPDRRDVPRGPARLGTRIGRQQ